MLTVAVVRNVRLPADVGYRDACDLHDTVAEHLVEGYGEGSRVFEVPWGYDLGIV